MRKIKLLLLGMLICLALPAKILALENYSCQRYDSGKENITFSNKESFENILKQKVAQLNNENNDSHYQYKINIINNTDETKTEEEIVKVSYLFDTIENAFEYFNKELVESPFVKGTHFIKPVEILDTITGTGQEKVCKTLDCSVEINKIRELLNSDQQLNYEIIIENGNIVKIQVEYEENGSIKYFDTIDLAKAFAKDYVPEKEEYSFVNNEIIPITVSTQTLKSYLELKGKDTFNNIDEARTLLEEFKQEYPQAVGTVDKIKNGEMTLTGTLEFDNQEQAISKADELSINTDYESCTTSIRKEITKTDIKKINGVYNSEEEIESAIQELEKLDYIVEKEVTQVSKGIDGTVISGISHPSANRYEFNLSDTNFILIKQGSGHYAVWTEYELTNLEKANFVKTYNMVNSGKSKFDGSTTNISIDDISWIFGFKSHDLSFIGKNWGIYQFSQVNDRLIINCDAKKVSHVIQGYANSKIKYILSGIKYKEKTIWYVDYVKTIYNFIYKINAQAVLQDTAIKYKVLSNFEKIEKVAKMNYSIDTTTPSEKYELSYEKYVPNMVESTTVEWEIEKCNNNYYPDPPHTGIDINKAMNISYIIMIFSASLSIGVYKLLKNN